MPFDHLEQHSMEIICKYCKSLLGVREVNLFRSGEWSRGSLGMSAFALFVAQKTQVFIAMEGNPKRWLA